mgnify:CR=1 FL=1
MFGVRRIRRGLLTHAELIGHLLESRLYTLCIGSMSLVLRRCHMVVRGFMLRW